MQPRSKTKFQTSAWLKLDLYLYKNITSISGRLAMTTNHTSIIQTYRWLAADDTEMEQLTPCCAPVSYSSQSILYFDGDKVQETRIPNVSVTRCGCI